MDDKKKFFFTCIVLLTILINILLFLINIFDIFTHWEPVHLLNAMPSGERNNFLPMDPVRWWPSGVLESMVVVGTALATLTVLSRMPNVSPRTRVLVSLGVAGASTVNVTYHSTLKNAVGFDRLMFGLTKFAETGSWPSLDIIARQNSDSAVQAFADKAMEQVDLDQSKVASIVNEVNGNGYLGISSENVQDFLYKVFQEIVPFLHFNKVEGHLDDLIGQRMVIEMLLFLSCIFVVILFIVFIINVILFINKDKIKNKFENKFFKFYIEYQAFMIKITLFYVPIFILLGLSTIFEGLYWLLTNQIPFQVLDIDLHQFVSLTPVAPTESPNVNQT